MVEVTVLLAVKDADILVVNHSAEETICARNYTELDSYGFRTIVI